MGKELGKKYRNSLMTSTHKERNRYIKFEINIKTFSNRMFRMNKPNHGQQNRKENYLTCICRKVQYGQHF